MAIRSAAAPMPGAAQKAADESPGGIRLRVLCDATGLWSSDVAVDARVDGGRAILDARVPARQVIATDLSLLRDVGALSAAVACCLREAETVPGSNACTFQLSAAQAQDATVRRLLGRLPVHVILDAERMPGETAFARLETFECWSCITRAQTFATCPVLGPETAVSALPGSKILLPSGAAALVVTLDVAAVTPDDAERFDAFAGAGARAVRLAERVFDRLRWVSAALAADAFMSRRLAIVPTGIGDLTLASGRDPADPCTLGWLRSILAALRRGACRASAAAAARHGRFPALEAEHVFSHLRGHPEHAAWMRRWRLATQASQFRHRNLLFPSVAALWPRLETANPAYLHLLPLLAEGHGIGFGERWRDVGANARQRLTILRMAGAAANRPRRFDSLSF